MISLLSFSSPAAGLSRSSGRVSLQFGGKNNQISSGGSMRGVFAVLVSSLVVLCMLYVLVSEDRNAPSSSELMQRTKTFDAGDRLVEALMLRRQRQSDYSNIPNTDQVSKAQEVLKNDGIYSGPVDGRMSQS